MDKDLVYELFVKFAEMGFQDGRDVIVEGGRREYKGNALGTLSKREEKEDNIKMFLYKGLDEVEAAEETDEEGTEEERQDGQDY